MVSEYYDDEWRSCKSKIRYDDGDSAQGVIRANIKRGIRSSSYRCDLCSGWHLTTATDGRNRLRGTKKFRRFLSPTERVGDGVQVDDRGSGEVRDLPDVVEGVENLGDILREAFDNAT